jgi:hypothetical protein
MIGVEANSHKVLLPALQELTPGEISADGQQKRARSAIADRALRP